METIRKSITITGLDANDNLIEDIVVIEYDIYHMGHDSALHGDFEEYEYSDAVTIDRWQELADMLGY